jgi:hypothetical protein
VTAPYSTFSPADVVVVGGGPAGLTAAIAAADLGAQVFVFEQLDRPAVRLAAATDYFGLACTADVSEVAGRFGGSAEFVLPALQTLDAPALCRFLQDLGVQTRSPNGGSIVPASNRAADVQVALWRRVDELLGVSLRLGARVTGLRLNDHQIVGLATDAGLQTVPRVILATGGKASSQLGATGSGYALAAQGGHTIVDPRPALVPLMVKEDWPRACAGARHGPVRAWIEASDQTEQAAPEDGGASDAGEVVFTRTGIAGSAVLDISGDVAETLAREGAVAIRLSFLPGTDAEGLLARFEEWADSGTGETLTDRLASDLPSPVVRALAEEAGVANEALPEQVGAEARRRLAELLTAAPLTVIGTEGFSKALATRGGVRLSEVDRETLQSKLLSGLYLAGEMLDLDAPTGGYNLHWAFASGYLAGRSAASGL